jgi:hypothetical protein
VELDARLVKSGAAGFWPVVGSVVAARRGRKDASHQMKIVWRDHLPREFVFWHVSTSALHVCRPGPVARTGRDPIQDQRDMHPVLRVWLLSVPHGPMPVGQTSLYKQVMVSILIICRTKG